MKAALTIACAAALLLTNARAATVTGTTTYAGPFFTAEDGDEIAVALIPLVADQGALLPLDCASVQGAYAHANPSGTPARYTVATGAPGPFRFDGVALGNYSAIAFVRRKSSGGSGRGWIDFTSAPQLGVHTGDGCLAFAQGGEQYVCLLPVEVTAHSAAVTGVDIRVRTLHPPAAPGRVTAPPDPNATLLPNANAAAAFGVLRDDVNGTGVRALRVRGTAWQRGWAHGYLLAQDIVSFFDFFLLDARVRGGPGDQQRRYAAMYAAGARFFDVTPRFRAMADGVVAGMHARAAAGGPAPASATLGRNLTWVDVMLINAYGDRKWLAMLAGGNATALDDEDGAPPRAGDCTQFVFWGSELTGGVGTIAGRNMDGENDLRKVTVSHVLLFAEEPADPAEGKKMVHVMWPGFARQLFAEHFLQSTFSRIGAEIGVGHRPAQTLSSSDKSQ